MSVVETLALIRSLLPNPRFLILKGEQRRTGWNAKALGYEIENNYPVFTDDELVAAVAAGQLIAVETGKPNGLFDVEFDPYEALGSVGAEEWIAENISRLEGLVTIVVKSPRSGFHVWGLASSEAIDLDTLTDWLWKIQEDPSLGIGEEPRIKPDTIHFQSVNGSDYCILPPSPGYKFLGKNRSIREL